MKSRDPQSRSMLVLCPYPIGVAAGQRLKFEQYYDDWRSAGWTVTTSPFMSHSLWRHAYERGHLARKAIGVARGFGLRMRDLFRIRRYDLVYCFMYATPIGGSGMERLVRRLSKRLVFDVEDNVIGELADGLNDHPNRLLRLLKGKGKATYLIRTADHVISSSPMLNDRCRELNRKNAATYISSSVDTARFVPRGSYEGADKPVIGWTGTFSSRPYLDLLRPVFEALARTHKFKLRVIGNFDYEFAGMEVEAIRWSAEQEVSDLQGIDIGVYPLPNDDWVIGKSGLKAITYMAMGIPCVATDVGTTPMIIRDGENGLLARTPEEWVDALGRLLDDADLRRRLGQQARADAVAKYSTTAIAADYRRVLDSVMSKA
ncbi:MAG: glycosyltransferase family 4 protein [Pseudomonadota bacterium]